MKAGSSQSHAWRVDSWWPLQNLLALAALSLMFAAPLAAQTPAQAYPTRPIKIISPGAPGAGGDAVLRVFAEPFSKRLGVPVVIENRVGAGGVIGADVVAKAPADGYTLLFGQQDAQVLLPLLRKNMPYDAFRDFVPIAKFGENSLIMVANPALKVSNARQLAELAKSKPGVLTFASAASGGINHLGVELFIQLAGINMLHVPYKGGAAAATAAMAGEVDVFVGSYTLLGKSVESGRLKAIGVTGSKRLSLMPDVPTIAESGYPTYLASSWYGLLGPAGLQPAVLSTLVAASLSAAQSPEMRTRHASVGSSPEAIGSEGFASFLKEDYARWKQVIERARITLDN